MNFTSRLRHLALLLLLLGPCASNRSVASAEPEELLQSFVAALNHADVDALVELFDPEATAFLPLDSVPTEVVGRDAIRAAFVPFFRELRQQGAGPEYMHLVPKNVLTQRAGDALAVVAFDAGSGPVISRRTLVLRRTQAGWRILHFHGSNVRKSAAGGT